jgi:hypothetical protein
MKCISNVSTAARLHAHTSSKTDAKNRREGCLEAATNAVRSVIVTSSARVRLAAAYDNSVMARHKRRGPANSRAGCKLCKPCKPYKDQRYGKPRAQRELGGKGGFGRSGSCALRRET